MVPAERLEAVISRAEALLKVERSISSEVRKGKDLASLLRYDELLTNKSTAGGLPRCDLQRLPANGADAPNSVWRNVISHPFKLVRSVVLFTLHCIRASGSSFLH